MSAAGQHLEEQPAPSAGVLRRIAGWSWPASFPIVQFPNAPLAVALLASAASRLTEDTAQRSLKAVFYLGLGIWAYEELRRGENWFRRLLGAGFVVYVLSQLTSALRG